MTVRQVVLDTETTGLDPEQGHRVIEIGCVELMQRRQTGNHFHQYVNPEREIDEAAFEVHGISQQFLADKPRFGDIAGDFIEFVRGAELIIHNAAFDTAFLNHELRRIAMDFGEIEEFCEVLDTLALARRLHPGQHNSLDALCRRYAIDNSQRSLHGALLDAEILADVYLAMTGGQTTFLLDAGDSTPSSSRSAPTRHLDPARRRTPVLHPDDEERTAHETWLDYLEETTQGNCLWRRLT
ncbi:MAG: DNA polymerase III subunit epsilon [Gammaproteobacteria bacterium]|nr:DNA polymerase III subunit epsilon [Gammaproteobacteria bacterium]